LTNTINVWLDDSIVDSSVKSHESIYDSEDEIYYKNALLDFKEALDILGIDLENMNSISTSDIADAFDSCKENFPDIEETLVSFSRDGERYGIVFIISATNMSSVYSILRRNFHQQLVLDMKDIGDYIDILGKIGNVYPAGFDGRGLFKDDIVYEFQTAQICDPDNLVQFVKNKIELVKEKSNVLAPNIPVLPEVVTIDILDKDIKDLKKLPIGINKDSLKTVYYDFFADKATIISSKDVVNCIDFLKGVIYGVRKLHHMTVLIDTEQMLSSIGGMVNTYADKNFEEFILMFEQFLDREIDGKNIKVLCIIAGLEKFQGSMNEDMVNGFFNGVQTLDNVNLIFVDSSFKLKKVGFEPWYDAVTNNSNGIWIGSGFMEQNVFNCSEFNADHREKINKQYAWIIKNNEADLVKIMGEKEKDEE
jgi:S-DNA-T family DNA segregation ATPase FtsK/SpoIIIE